MKLPETLFVFIDGDKDEEFFNVSPIKNDVADLAVSAGRKMLARYRRIDCWEVTRGWEVTREFIFKPSKAKAKKK